MDLGAELHVIFGGGQVGQPLARILRERGLRVRIARRSTGGPEGVEVMRGDATDRSFCLGSQFSSTLPDRNRSLPVAAF